MLDLLETLRSVAVSGQEPASFLIVLRRGEAPLLIATVEPRAELTRLHYHYGPIPMAFQVRARRLPAGLLLEVSDPTGRTGYCLDQLCRPTALGRWEALPHCWAREDRGSRAPLGLLIKSDVRHEAPGI